MPVDGEMNAFGAYLVTIGEWEAINLRLKQKKRGNGTIIINYFHSIRQICSKRGTKLGFEGINNPLPVTYCAVQYFENSCFKWLKDNNVAPDASRTWPGCVTDVQDGQKDAASQ